MFRRVGKVRCNPALIHHRKPQLMLYSSNTDPDKVKELKTRLEQFLDYLTEKIDPICSEWLTHPSDSKFIAQILLGT